MNTTSTARFVLSISAGLGLAAFTAISFVASGISAPSTVLGFSFLTVYGLFEIALLDYAPAVRTSSVRAARNPGRLVEFPAAPANHRRAA